MEQIKKVKFMTDHIERMTNMDDVDIEQIKEDKNEFLKKY